MLNVLLTLQIKQKEIVPTYKLPDRTKAFNNLVLIEEKIRDIPNISVRQFFIELKKQ